MFFTALNFILKKIGIQVKKYPDSDLKRRMQLIKNFNIDTILDVGANAGQYASLIRAIGFKGRIISFEPVSAAFARLIKNSAGKKNWEIHQYALGDFDGTAEINVASNSFSSSLLDMLPEHEKSAPESSYIGKETIKVRKLGSVFNELVPSGANVYLKIDTQGFEKNVIDGAADCLGKVTGLQLELSLIPLYKNEMLLPDMIQYLEAKGFTLYSLENGFYDVKTGQLLQSDGIFFR